MSSPAPAFLLRLVCLSTDVTLETTLRDALDQTLGPGAVRLDVTDPAAPDPDLLARADGIVCGDTLPGIVHAAAPRLRWVQFWSVGMENTIMPAAPPLFADGRGVTMCGAPSLHAASCAEHVLALLLAFARGLPAAFAAGRHRDGQEESARRFPARFELEGKTIGIVGAGTIGQAVGVRCQAFGMQTVGLRRDVRKPTRGINVLLPHLRYHDLILASDIVVLALPLTPDTRLMFGEDELEIIKKSAFVINIGRAGVLDESWLARALQNRWIAGAGLSVFADEPLPPDSPFWSLPNCIITPHPSDNVTLDGPRFARFVAAQARRLLRGEALENCLDPRHGC